jgi:hypothetical protein
MLAFAACAFPVHVWTIVSVMREIPAWVLRLSAWQLVGVISYALMVALLESVLLLIGLLVLKTLLPTSVFDDGFVSQAGMLVLLISGWAVTAHYNYDVIRLWGMRQLALWGLVCLASVGIGYGLIRRFKRLEGLFRAIIERVSVLSFIYLFADLVAVMVVIIRNVQGSV